jgi:Chaperone for flagella basal body P-ring formation
MVTVLLLAGARTTVRAEDAPRTLISRDCILRALHSSGIPIPPEQMEELSGMTATEPNPPLKVLSIDLLDADSDKVLLRCDHPNTCLPFYVLVHWGRLEDGSAARPGRPERKPAQPEPRTAKLLVRSGRTVVLMLEGEYIHMTLPVLCLQNGGRGQQVRVISKDTKKRYVARVTGPGVVTSALSE